MRAAAGGLLRGLARCGGWTSPPASDRVVPPAKKRYEVRSPSQQVRESSGRKCEKWRMFALPRTSNRRSSPNEHVPSIHWRLRARSSTADGSSSRASSSRRKPAVCRWRPPAAPARPRTPHKALLSQAVTSLGRSAAPVRCGTDGDEALQRY